MTPQRQPLYGLMAEFADPQALVDAAHKAYDAGYRKMDAYSPFPIEELSEAIGFHHSNVQLLVLLVGIFVCIGGFWLEYCVSAVAYPVNIGGRPYASWVAFIPPAFETTILCAAFAAVFGMLALNGLPEPYHPVFNSKRFDQASRDKFFLVVQARDPKFDLDKTWQFLESLHPREVTDVPWRSEERREGKEW